MPAVRAGLANLSTVGQSNAHVIRGSLRFAGPSSDYLSRDFGAGNQKTYTISFWAKPSNHDEHGSVGTGEVKFLVPEQLVPVPEPPLDLVV